MNFHLKVWRQSNAKAEGKLVDYDAPGIPPQASVLEMLDIVNERLVLEGEDPIAFDSDCREGICGTCSLSVNGEAHGPDHPGAACELYMRKFKDGQTIVIEPFRVKSFPIVKDLVVDRSALDRIVQAGGFISARAGSAPEANSIPARARRHARMHPRCSSLRRRFRISRFCLKASRNASNASLAWSGRWTRKVLAIARTLTNAKRFARRKSAPALSPN